MAAGQEHLANCLPLRLPDSLRRMMGFELDRTASNRVELVRGERMKETSPKSYEIRRMVEVDRT